MEIRSRSPLIDWSSYALAVVLLAACGGGADNQDSARPGAPGMPGSMMRSSAIAPASGGGHSLVAPAA